MYQDKLSLLKTTDIRAAQTHATTPSPKADRARRSRNDLHALHVSRARERKHDVPRARVRPARLPVTGAQAHRQHQNIAIIRALYEADGTDLTSLVSDEGARFDAGTLPEAVLARFFDEPLPIGATCAIPFGTSVAQIAEGEIMNELDQNLLDAIDAGASAIGRLSPKVAFFLRNSRAPSTRALYRWAWARALRTCAALDRCPMPMSEATATLVLVEGVNDGLAVGSLKIMSSVISVAHGLAKQPDPTDTEAFRSCMRGIGRVLSHQQDRKTALNADELLQIRESTDIDPNRARGTRDWSLTSFGFAGAFRRSEIVSRNHDDLEFVDDNELRVYLDRSKTDQFGRGTYVTIRAAKNPKLCPIRALHAWIAIAPGPGALFRPVTKHGRVVYRRLSATSVTSIVKGFGVVLDMPDDSLGAHSLRAGMVTALLESGVGELQTMQHSRHRSYDSLGRYYRPRANRPNFTELAGL
jgi:hypothetical protein